MNRGSRVPAVLALTALVLAGPMLVACAHRPAESASHTLTPITPASFASVRERFNQSADRTRVLMLVSPT